jgi:hypothetical protein
LRPRSSTRVYPPDAPDPDDLSGGKRADRRFVDWKFFFDLGGSPQQGKKIDTKLSSPLFALPFIPPNLPDNPASLAQRNLLTSYFQLAIRPARGKGAENSTVKFDRLG